MKHLLTGPSSLLKKKSIDDLYARYFVSWQFSGSPLKLHYGCGLVDGLDCLADAAALQSPSKALSEASADSTDTLSNSSPIQLLSLDPKKTCKSKLEVPSEDDELQLKPKRKRANAQQLEILRQTFQKTPFPDAEARKLLAKNLGMTARSVQIWFQNQRQIARSVLNNAKDHASMEAG